MSDEDVVRRLDAMPAEDALLELEREFPGWKTWKSVSGLFHARHASRPATSVWGEDPVDLRDKIRRVEAFTQAAEPGT